MLQSLNTYIKKNFQPFFLPLLKSTMSKPAKMSTVKQTMRSSSPNKRPAMRVIHLDLTMTQSEDARAKHKMRGAFEDLRGKTAFNDWELSCILLIYYKMTLGNPIGRPEFRNFIHSVFGISRQDIVERIFSALDEPNSPGLEPHAFVVLLSIFTRGSLDEKIDFVFQVYDSMCLGYIGREAMIKLLVPTLLTRRQEHEAVENAIDMVDLLIRKIDKDRDGRICYKEFCEQIRQNEKLLEVFSQVLPDRMDKYAFMATFTPRIATNRSKYIMKSSEQDMVDLLMRKMDTDKHGRLSYQSFKEQVYKNPRLLEVFGFVFPDRMYKCAFMTTISPDTRTRKFSNQKNRRNVFLKKRI